MVKPRRLTKDEFIERVKDLYIRFSNQLYNDDFIFNIDVDGQTINGKVSMASLKDKI